jgi:hypothetical protein
MSNRLLALNLLLAVTTAVFSFQLVRILSTPRSLSPPSLLPASPTVASQMDGPAPARPSLPAYGVVATKNLFNPNRSEATSPTPQRAPAAKPVLHGVVIDGETRLAYLEDPAAKRVFGYKIGDTVAGGQVERIEEDRVVIKLAEGSLEVMLKDPSKPKPVLRGPAPSITPPAARVPVPGPPGGPRPPNLLRRSQGGAGAPGAPTPSE